MTKPSLANCWPLCKSHMADLLIFARETLFCATLGRAANWPTYFLLSTFYVVIPYTHMYRIFLYIFSMQYLIFFCTSFCKSPFSFVSLLTGQAYTFACLKHCNLSYPFLLVSYLLLLLCTYIALLQFSHLGTFDL